MSEREFENYLALLGGLLRLGTRQRAEIAGELRDHLEERLAELTADGVPHEEAVGQALAEFGDAASMAAAFLDISRNRRRRWIMKWTAYSIGGLAALVILAVSLWPEHANVKLTPKAAAQAVPGAVAPGGVPPGALPTGGGPGAIPPAAAKDDVRTREDNNVAAEAALSKHVAANFVDTPIGDVLEYVRELTGLEFYVNWKRLDEEGISKDAPVTINLKKVRVDMLLDLVLAQVGETAYVLRDGIVIVSSSADLENATEVRVYNCRDLLTLAPPVEGHRGAMMMAPGDAPGGYGGGAWQGGAARPGTAPSSPGPAAPGSGASTPPGSSGGPGMMPGMQGMASGMRGMGGMGGGPQVSIDEASARAEQLMNILTTAVAPDTWQESGGFGTVAQYSGLLVVNHNARTHRQIEKVLLMLREAAAKDAAAAKPVGMQRGR